MKNNENKFGRWQKGKATFEQRVFDFLYDYNRECKSYAEWAWFTEYASNGAKMFGLTEYFKNEGIICIEEEN